MSNLIHLVGVHVGWRLVRHDLETRRSPTAGPGPVAAGELSAILLVHLLTAPGFEALDAARPRRAPQDGRLSVLDENERQRIRRLEGHLIELETGHSPEGSSRPEYDPDLHTMDEREQAKLAELRAAGTEMTQRHLQRLRQAFI